MELKTVLRLLNYLIIIGRIRNMYKNTMNVVKGVGMGMLAGVAVAAVSTKAMGSKKKATHMKKSAGKAIHTVGNLIGDVEKMLR